MHRLLRTLGRQIAMLLIAAMVVLPVAEALSCSLEPVDAHSSSVADAHDDGADDDASSTHGLCSHSHCHHSTAAVPSSVALQPEPERRAVPLPLGDGRHRSNRPDQLKRPPRI